VLQFVSSCTYVHYLRFFIFTSAKDLMFLPVFVCLFVCLSNLSNLAQSTSDSILGVIQQESWILDHFEIFVTIALKRA